MSELRQRPKSQELNEYQQDLATNEEKQRDFVLNNNNSSEYSDDSDDHVRIFHHRSSRKSNIDLILEQLIYQQNLTRRAERKLSELQRELDREETAKRYIELNLNNREVERDQYKEQCKHAKQILLKTRVALALLIFINVLYFFYL